MAIAAPIVIALVVAAALVFLVVRGRQRTAAAAEAWQARAAALGLEHAPERGSPGVVTGSLDGVRVEARYVTRSSGVDVHRSYTFTLARAWPDAAPDDLLVFSKASQGQWFLDAAALRRVDVDDPAFTSALSAFSAHPEQAADWLDPDRRAAFLRAHEATGGLALTGGVLQWEQRKMLHDGERLGEVLTALADLARALDRE